MKIDYFLCNMFNFKLCLNFTFLKIFNRPQQIMKALITVLEAWDL